MKAQKQQQKGDSNRNLKKQKAKLLAFKLIQRRYEHCDY